MRLLISLLPEDHQVRQCLSFYDLWFFIRMSQGNDRHEIKLPAKTEDGLDLLIAPDDLAKPYCTETECVGLQQHILKTCPYRLYVLFTVVAFLCIEKYCYQHLRCKHDF